MYTREVHEIGAAHTVSTVSQITWDEQLEDVKGRFQSDGGGAQAFKCILSWTLLLPLARIFLIFLLRLFTPITLSSFSNIIMHNTNYVQLCACDKLIFVCVFSQAFVT